MSHPVRDILPALMSNVNRTRREAEAIYTKYLEENTITTVGALLQLFSNQQEVCCVTRSCIFTSKLQVSV